MQRWLLQSFTYILEWRPGTCTLTKHTWRWTYSALRHFKTWNLILLISFVSYKLIFIFNAFYLILDTSFYTCNLKLVCKLAIFDTCYQLCAAFSLIIWHFSVFAICFFLYHTGYLTKSDKVNRILNILDNFVLFVQHLRSKPWTYMSQFFVFFFLSFCHSVYNFWGFQLAKALVSGRGSDIQDIKPSTAGS